ncbi:hypothetical protein C8J57DRAFT_1319979 [Mycena rebaudengoi]|nr:hypothetical protein C8J57DRAFT_1319979 [Mycena rebaudengoi]
MATSKSDNLRARLADLDRDIQCPPSRLDDLETERSAIQNELASIVYPVLDLPPEVVSVIFIACLPVYSATPHPLRAPLLLCAICSAWRKIALSTPQLWTTFIFSVDLGRTNLSSGVDGLAVVELFECWISRAGACPLTMIFSCVTPYQARVSTSLPHRLLDALSRSSSQWYDVALALPFYDFYRLKANQGLPLLRRLAIRSSEPDSGLLTAHEAPPLKLFAVAPSLRDIHMGKGFILSKLILPMHQLTDFDSPTEILDCLDLLRRAPRLARITIYMRGHFNRESSGGPIRSNLTSLALESRSWDDHSLDVLHCLTCPALESLIISGALGSALDPEPLLDFLSRSSPSLQQFVVDSTQLATGGLVRCLSSMPSLRRLEVGSLLPQVANEIFHYIGDTSSLVLPRLEQLRVHIMVDDSWTYNELVCMLTSRWNVSCDNVARLQEFELDFMGYRANSAPRPNAEVISMLAVLVHDGMSIDIGDDHESLDG